MSLNGIYPTWLGDVGSGEPSGTTIIDSIAVELLNEVAVEIKDDDPIDVVVQMMIEVEVDD